MSGRLSFHIKSLPLVGRGIVNATGQSATFDMAVDDAAIY